MFVRDMGLACIVLIQSLDLLKGSFFEKVWASFVEILINSAIATLTNFCF